jgi:hypothetical protein
MDKVEPLMVCIGGRGTADYGMEWSGTRVQMVDWCAVS